MPDLQTKCQKVIIELAFETFITKLRNNGGIKGRLINETLKEFHTLGYTYVTRDKLEYLYKKCKQDQASTTASTASSQTTTAINHDVYSQTIDGFSYPGLSKQGGRPLGTTVAKKAEESDLIAHLTEECAKKL